MLLVLIEASSKIAHSDIHHHDYAKILNKNQQLKINMTKPKRNMYTTISKAIHF